MPTSDPPFGDEARLHVVTGKGGTGKTTVATALAMAMADGGHSVLLAEVEQRNGFEHLLGDERVGTGESLTRTYPSGGSLFTVAIDPRAALQEYLEMYYKLGLAGRLIDRAGAVDFAASIAPGLRDVLLTGKVYEAVTRRDKKGRARYDAVVLDAPPTGRVGKFLGVTTELTGLAKVGPVHNQARSVMTLFRSPATVVHVVTLAEEMPVTETVEAIDELTELGLRPGAIVVNQVREPVLRLADLRAAAAGRLDADAITADLRQAGVADPAQTALALVADAAGQAGRIAVQRRELDRLKSAGRPLVRLPHLVQGVDADSVGELAAALAEGAMA